MADEEIPVSGERCPDKAEAEQNEGGCGEAASPEGTPEATGEQAECRDETDAAPTPATE